MMYKNSEKDIIRPEDIALPGALDDYLIAEFDRLLKILPITEAAIKKMAGSISSDLKGMAGNLTNGGMTVEGMTKMNSKMEESNKIFGINQKNRKLKADADKAEIDLQKKKLDLDDKVLARDKKKEDQMRKNIGFYAELNAKRKEEVKIYQDLAAKQVLHNNLTSEEAAEMKRAELAAQGFDAKLKGIDYTIGNAQRNVGNYHNQLGTLGKTVKGFSALGNILAKALGIDVTIFDTIKESGKALLDIKHVIEGVTIAKAGETAAHEANTAAVETETAAVAISTGGLTLLVAAIIAAGVATVILVSNMKEEQAIGDALKKVEERRLEIFKETKTLQRANAIAGRDQTLAQMVLDGKITQEESDRMKARSDARIEEKDLNDKMMRELKQTASELEVIIDPKSGLGVVSSSRKRLDAYEQSRFQIVQKYAALRVQNEKKAALEVNAVNQDAEAESKKEREKAHEDALKKLAEITQKANDDSTKSQAVTNEEKAKADYAIAIREINQVKATEKEKLEARIAVDKYYAGLIRLAQQKDQEDEDKIRIDAEKKRMQDNAKQAEKDFQTTIAQDQKQEAEELQAIEEKYAKQKDHSVKAEKEKFLAILQVKLKHLQIEKQLNEDDPTKQAQLDKQIADLKTAAAKEGLSLDEKLNDEKNKLQKKLEDDLTDGLKEGLSKRSELQQAADQADVDYHKKMIDVQAKLAAEGKDNVLAEEIAASQKAEERKIQDQKRAAKAQENITLLKTFSDTLNKALESGKPFFSAFAEASASTGLVKAVFSTLFSYKEGTEDTGGRGTIDKDGGKLAIIHPHERIMTAEQNAMLSGMTNAQVAYNAMMYDRMNSMSSTFSSSDYRMTATLGNKIERLIETIEGKPTEHVSLGGLGEWTKTIERNGIRRTTNYVNNQRRPRL